MIGNTGMNPPHLDHVDEPYLKALHAPHIVHKPDLGSTDMIGLIVPSPLYPRDSAAADTADKSSAQSYRTCALAIYEVDAKASD